MVSPGGRTGTGGICRVVDDLARAWDAAGDAPPVRVIDSGAAAPTRASAAARWLCALATVATLVARRRVHVLHVHVSERGSLLRKAGFVLVGRIGAAPVVLHLHGAEFASWHDRRGRLGRFVIRALFRQADAVIALGARARDHLTAAVGVEPGRVAVVPNGVAPAASRPVRCGNVMKCRIAFVGALGARKGLDTLLAALAAPSLAAVPLSVRIVGNGDVGRWSDEGRRRGIDNRLEWLGWQPNQAARAVVASSDVLVLASRAEALPIAILEALAERVAVIATDVGDVADAVVDNETGLLVPPGDATALADAIGTLATDPARRAALAEAGRARAAARFDLADTARLTREVLERAARSRRARRTARPLRGTLGEAA